MKKVSCTAITWESTWESDGADQQRIGGNAKQRGVRLPRSKKPNKARRKRRSVKKSVAYLVHKGRHKHLKGPSAKPRRGDGAIPHRFAPFKLAEDDDEQEEETIKSNSETRHCLFAHVDKT